MREVLTSLCLIGGGLIMLLAGLGLVRLPDLFLRMQAATKAVILGLGLLLVAVTLHFGSGAIAVRAALVLAFIFLTGPVSAHVLARAAYSVGVPLWSGTRFDDLRDRLEKVDDLSARCGAPQIPEPTDSGGSAAP